MGRNDILKVPGNEENLEKLISQKKSLVPFIGTGFSVPACPTWSDFLDLFFKRIKDEYLPAEEKYYYLELKNNRPEKKFEKLADLLAAKSGRHKFEEEMRAHFDKPLLPQMMPKFQLLYQAFPGLKITTNLDCLVENNTPGPYVRVCYGDLPGELEQLLTHIDKNSLLKIYGGLGNIHSIVLSSSQYAALYGDPAGFDPHAPLPLFLKQLFTNCSLLFIGCSLTHDRTIMIMENLKDMRPHFAIMRRPGQKQERVKLEQHLSNLGITPIWIMDFGEIEEILRRLVEPVRVHTGPPIIQHGVPFVGRVKELEQIRKNLEKANFSSSVQVITSRLFSFQDVGGLGKTTLAFEAANRFSPQFKDGVLAPIRVSEHTPMSFAMHLADKLQLKVTEPPDEEAAQQMITDILKERHALLILDNAVDWKNLKYMLPVETRCAILITTCTREMFDSLRLQFPGFQVCEIPLEQFTNIESLELFQRVLGGKYQANLEDIYLEIAKNLGFLPLALRQSISLMLFGPRYTATRLQEQLSNEDRLALLRKGQPARESDRLIIEYIFDLSFPLLTRVLLETLQYLAVCSPGPVPLDFLQQLAKDEAIEERLERLFAFSWCECRGTGAQRAYELHHLVRELVRQRFENRFQKSFIQLVHDIFTDDTIHFSIKEKFYPQLEEALLAAAANRDKRLIDWLYDLYDFCTSCGFSDFYIRLTQWVKTLFPGDQWALRVVYGHRALIYSRHGKLEEAMKLHKKEEKTCKELGDRAGLARSYGNLARILNAGGKLPEAMKLHKKEEKICEKLGLPAGLARSYGSQALILRKEGKLPEAMALHKKEEEIYEELGLRAGLARSYGSQALIRNAEGKLTEAMKLHEKEEEIYEELGLRAGLARSYNGQTLILKEEGKLSEAMALNKKEEKICEELGDRAGLARSYGTQALILKAEKKLSEAMALHKKEEEIYEELGLRARLAHCYGSQALILKERGKLPEAMALHKKEEKICEELGDHAGLARSYGSQALILKAEGKLQEAMILYKKVEEIFEELGHRARLALNYGNLALILPDWGKLLETMAVHKKQEKIK